MNHGKVTDFETVQSAENLLKKIWTSGNNRKGHFETHVEGKERIKFVTV